jgi:hypothetical protein
MLDTTRLKAELGNIQAHLARVITGPRGGEVVRPLRQVADLPAPPGRLLWQALHNDCLRVIYVAINADDRVADEEIEDTYEYLFQRRPPLRRALAGGVRGPRRARTRDRARVPGLLRGRSRPLRLPW